MNTTRPTYAFRRRLKLRQPMVPNFLTLTGGGTVPVGDVDDKTLKQIGRDWIKALVANAKRQRHNGGMA